MLPQGIPGNGDKDRVWFGRHKLDSQGTYLVQGASGRGKSTFLHLILGIRRDYGGQILFDEEDIRAFNNNQWAAIRRETFAMVFQDLRLLGEMTAIENLLLKARLVEDSQSNRIEELAGVLDIREQLNKPCHKLSHGQQQRLAILRALLQPFRILLLDEPFSHLDPDITQTCLNLIQQTCQKRNAGMILATHDNDYGLDYDKKLLV